MRSVYPKFPHRISIDRPPPWPKLGVGTSLTESHPSKWPPYPAFCVDLALSKAVDWFHQGCILWHTGCASTALASINIKYMYTEPLGTVTPCGPQWQHHIGCQPNSLFSSLADLFCFLYTVAKFPVTVTYTGNATVINIHETNIASITNHRSPFDYCIM